jgi:polysaccharide pyruvyl transferase CsaB
MDMPVRIGISGSYGGMNLGDEAILESMLQQLRASVTAHITVFSRNPADTLERHRVESAISAGSLTRKEVTPVIRDLDVLILGGGGILYDRHAEAYLREVNVAHELGVPVFVYAISAGPLNTRSARLAVQASLSASPTTVITVRDRLGYRLLDDLGVTNEIHVTADPALLLEPEPLGIETWQAEGVDFTRQVVGFSVREPGPAAPDLDPEQYHEMLANAADFIVERLDAEVLFVPMEKIDVRHSHAVVAHMRHAEHAEILRRRYSPRQILDLIGRLAFAVGMRLHFLIFSAVRGTPFAALPYAPKVSGLLEDLDLGAPPLGNMGTGQLIGRIDRKWDHRARLRDEIEQRVPELQQRAARTHELLLELLARLPSAR